MFSALATPIPDALWHAGVQAMGRPTEHGTNVSPGLRSRQLHDLSRRSALEAVVSIDVI